MRHLPVHSPNGHMCRAEPKQSQEPRTSSGSPTRVLGPKQPSRSPSFRHAIRGIYIRHGAVRTQTSAHIGCHCHRWKINLIHHLTDLPKKPLCLQLSLVLITLLTVHLFCWEPVASAVTTRNRTHEKGSQHTFSPLPSQFNNISIK